MKNPPAQAQAILEVIVKNIPTNRFNAKNPKTFLGYKEVHDELKLTLEYPKTYGQSLRDQGLKDLALWTQEHDHPAVTGLIVDQMKFKPGEGFFDVYNRSEDDLEWWYRQAEASLRYDWRPYISFSETEDSPLETQMGESVSEPPSRVEAIISRIVRDTKKAKRVKLIHRHICQLCETRLELKDGSFYSEAHHIQPLGKDHNGPDVIGNILCVCPNCHALLDYGAIPLKINELRISGHHDVDQRFIDYHNKKIHCL